MPEIGATYTIPDNLCQQAAGNFAHVATGGIVEDGTGFMIRADHPEHVFGLLSTGGIRCTGLFQVYDPPTNSCVGL